VDIRIKQRRPMSVWRIRPVERGVFSTADWRVEELRARSRVVVSLVETAIKDRNGIVSAFDDWVQLVFFAPPTQ